jgi:hypothetical protein
VEKLEVNNDNYFNRGYLKLPITDGDFKEFISKLLGKSEMLEGVFFGHFELTREVIRDLTDMLDQRITQQNKGKLIHFIVKFYFSNNTTQTVTDFPSFLTFREAKKIVCTRVDVSWIYLLTFENKAAPEKQEINMTFISRENGFRKISGTNFIPSYLHDNIIKYEVRHTARTWGIDIESLIRSFLKNFISEDNKFMKFVKNNNSKIGLLTFVLIILSYVYTFIKSINNYSSELMDKINSNSSLEEKIDSLTRIIVTGDWNKFSIISFLILLGAIIIAILLGIWVSATLEVDEISYLLFSDESQKKKDKIERSKKRQWGMFILSLVTSIICGLLSNYIFKFIFKC